MFGRQIDGRGSAVRERGAERAKRVTDDAVVGLTIDAGCCRPADRCIRRPDDRCAEQVIVGMGNDQRRQPGQQQDCGKRLRERPMTTEEGEHRVRGYPLSGWGSTEERCRSFSFRKREAAS